LHEIGINERAMFPDLEGVGKQIAWEWKSIEVPAGKVKAAARKRVNRNSDASSSSGTGSDGQ
jgi:hypothetical protein